LQVDATACSSATPKSGLLRDNMCRCSQGKIGSLRRFKDDASQVTNGHGVRHHRSIQLRRYKAVGDVIEAFATERIAAEVIA
jgi:translation initiation factor IF-2